MREQNISIWQDYHINSSCCLQHSFPTCFNNKIINNSLEPFSSWVISQVALKEGSKGKVFTDREVTGVNYDHDYFISESDSMYYLFLLLRGQQWQHWWFTWDVLICLHFTFHKAVQLLWQLEVYRVCFKTCVWQFMCINLLHTDITLVLCFINLYFLCILDGVYFINDKVRRGWLKKQFVLRV